MNWENGQARVSCKAWNWTKCYKKRHTPVCYPCDHNLFHGVDILSRRFVRILGNHLGSGQATTESVHVPGAEHHWIGSFYYWINNYDCRPGYTLAKLLWDSSLRVDHQLITHGIYRFTRNPMYLGLIMVVTGLPVYAASMYGFLISLVLIPIILNRIRLEEELLRRIPGWVSEV